MELRDSASVHRTGKSTGPFWTATVVFSCAVIGSLIWLTVNQDRLLYYPVTVESYEVTPRSASMEAEVVRPRER